jgi:hypothetical protein
MARWKWAKVPATASRRWNVLRRRALAEAHPQCRAWSIWVRHEVCDPRYRGAGRSIGPLPCLARLTQWRLGGLGRLGRHDPLLANGSLARLFWRALDAFDYWLTRAEVMGGGIKTQCPTLREGAAEDGRVTLDAVPPLRASSPGSQRPPGSTEWR